MSGTLPSNIFRMWQRSYKEDQRTKDGKAKVLAYRPFNYEFEEPARRFTEYFDLREDGKFALYSLGASDEIVETEGNWEVGGTTQESDPQTGEIGPEVVYSIIVSLPIDVPIFTIGLDSELLEPLWQQKDTREHAKYANVRLNLKIEAFDHDLLKLRVVGIEVFANLFSTNYWLSLK